MRGHAGKDAQGFRPPTPLHAMPCSNRCSKSWDWIKPSWLFPAGRPCQRGPWRSGRSGASTWSRCTARPRKLAPSYIESLVRASPYVAEAMVVGHARKYLAALIEIDYDAVADWARNHDVAYTGFTSLAQHAAVQRLIAAEIERANVALARVE